MREYCCSDTTILREGVLRFRDLMLEVTGTENTENTRRQSVDVLDYVTIASVCMGIYKTNFLKEQYDVEVKMQDTEHIEMKPMKSTQKGFDVWDQETWKSSDMFLSENSQRSFGQRKFVRSPLAHVPSEGYTKRFNHSRSSILWLEWMMNEENVFIQHALNRGEFKIPGTKFHVDGYCQETNDVFEFLGCHWHGCRKCFPCERSETKTPLTKQSMEELYVVTKKREQTIRGLGYGYRRIWEHDFACRLNSNKRLKIFAENHEIEERLDPRHAFFGGRTDTTKLYHKVGKDEQIKYVDFTSLYTWTNKYCRYPLHHPEIITNNFDDLDKYFGLCHVKILPPTNLYHAVLPYRCHGKLIFPLCRTCVETTNQGKCTHNDQERCITGTYATPEIMLAQEKGYRVLKVHEVWHFPDSTQYDKKTNSGGLFTDYVQMFLKIKQEASGFPLHCTSEEDKREYIRLYKENEGIELDYDNIKVNPGLRSLAKLCLNSFWGKFGQRLFLKRHSFFHESEADKFFQIVSDPTKVVENFHIVSNDTIQLEWSQHSKFPPVDVKTNIFIAIFTTMWARLKLYEVLDMLDERVLYTDTDSCIYVNKKGKPEPPLGNYLGELTSEIPADEGYIVEFVSGGPKTMLIEH
ncbi:unnamed protein product [Mytilus coruscus]|uniref:DNA-directed DNA polymerase n=1 Tax=Mytilus coruscus TaxID=42192 RepID=A0A6J8AIM7_MYTCO|nr:unnamed protein product [Mytilus coruscus]